MTRKDIGRFLVLLGISICLGAVLGAVMARAENHKLVPGGGFLVCQDYYAGRLTPTDDLNRHVWVPLGEGGSLIRTHIDTIGQYCYSRRRGDKLQQCIAAVADEVVHGKPISQDVWDLCYEPIPFTLYNRWPE
jgi:hypothetical protein